MRTLKSLIENNTDVWIFCRSESLQRFFLWQAENEGFMAINGQNPSTLGHQKLYGINNAMEVGYLSAMIWVLSSKADSNENTTTRIDYERYLAGENEYFYHGRLDDVPDRSLWDKLAYTYTDSYEFQSLCDAFIENQSYEDYKAYIYRWLIESTWHYSPKSAFAIVLDNADFIARSYAGKVSVSDCAIDVGYVCG